MLGIGQPGHLVGVFEDAPFIDDDVCLQPGDALVLFTDGVTEGRRDDQWFGDERLVATIAGVADSARSLVDGILGDVLAFQRGFPRDDIALVAIRVPEPGAPASAP